jgi:NAD(P)-dependent dehydrogenase (short-subunit alcohol dehydrogenase family)
MGRLTDKNILIAGGNSGIGDHIFRAGRGPHRAGGLDDSLKR